MVTDTGGCQDDGPTQVDVSTAAENHEMACFLTSIRKLSGRLWGNALSTTYPCMTSAILVRPLITTAVSFLKDAPHFAFTQS